MKRKEQQSTLRNRKLDYFSVKQVDRKLTFSVLKSNFLVCDVGGGTGIDSIPICCEALSVICLDVNKKALKSGKTRSRNLHLEERIDFLRASATHLPFRNYIFDLVTSFSVIDHLPDKANASKAVKEFSRVTKTHGFVVVTIPNRLFLFGTFLMKMKRMTEPETFFEQRFTPKELGNFFESSGLAVIEYDSKNPTLIGASIQQHNMPHIVQKAPKLLLRSIFLIAGRSFLFLENRLPLTMLGARFGCLGRKQ